MVKRIRFAIIDSDELLDFFAIRPLWLPFEAACLIRGYIPHKVVKNSAIVYINYSDINHHSIGEVESSYDEKRLDLINLTEAIIQKWGEDLIGAETIVEWALGKGEMKDSGFVRKVLGRVYLQGYIEEIQRLNLENDRWEKKYNKDTDGKGKHHQDKRLAILGSTIEELAKHLPESKIDNLMRGNTVNATGLATYLDTYRVDVKLPAPTTSGFSYRNIEDVLRLALSEARKH